jgi:hypothetical protein
LDVASGKIDREQRRLATRVDKEEEIVPSFSGLTEKRSATL